MIVVKQRQPKGSTKSRTFKASPGWRTVGDRRIYFRSGWEVNFAHYLQWLKEKKQIAEWAFEPKTFWFNEIKRGVRSYLPDFMVTRLNGTHYWVEVKGYMDAKSITKIKRMAKYYPEEELRVIDAKWFKEHREKLPFLVDRWEAAGAEGDKNELD